MALKNKPLSENKKARINIISDISKNKIDRKIDEIEDIIDTEISMERLKNSAGTLSMDEMMKKLGIF